MTRRARASRRVALLGGVLLLTGGAWLLSARGGSAAEELTATTERHPMPATDGQTPAPATASDGRVAAAESTRSEVAIDASANGSVRARLRPPVGLRLGSLFGLLDDRMATQSEHDPIELQFDAVPAGERRLLVGWVVAGPRLQIVDLTFQLAAGEQRDLGLLTLATTPVGWLRVDLEPDLTSIQTATLVANVRLGRSVLPLPVGVSMPVDGLGAAGFAVTATAAQGTRSLSGAAHLLPGQLVALVLDDDTPFSLEVVAWWPSSPGWLECNVVGGKAVRWARAPGISGAQLSLATQRHARLAVLSMVDRAGATRAFALRELQPGIVRIECALDPTVPVRGRWSGREGDRIGIALGAWPERDLWRAQLRADGTFAVPGLPVGVPLLLRGGEGPQRRYAVEPTDAGHQLVPAH